MLKTTLARPAERLKAYALIWDNADPLCKVVNGESKGTRYIDIASRLDGISSSICEADYTTTLERISQDVSRIFKHEFDLKFIPAADNLVMTLDGAPYTDFVVTGNKIKLNNIAETALKLKISYRYDMKPKFDKVKVTGPLDASTLEVVVGKTVLTADKYQWDDVEKEVFFVEMPADNADVKVKYRKNDILPATFNLSGQNLEEVFTKVQVDGKAVTNFTFDPTAMTLTFDTPPADGANVAVFSRDTNPEVTHYKLSDSVASDKILSVTAVDAATNEQIEVKLENGELVFDPSQVVADRNIIVTYDYGDKDVVLKHELAEEPLEGSVDIDVVSGDVDCINSVVLSGKSLQYMCNGDELEEIKVTYKYIAARYTEFTVGASLNEDTFVTVWIDGARTFDFVLKGNTVLVPENILTKDSVVRIIVTQ